MGWGFGVYGAGDLGGTGVRGAAKSMWLDGSSGIGVRGSADLGGRGLDGFATGLSHDGSGGIGAAGFSDSGGVGVFGANQGVNSTGSAGAGVYGSSDAGVGVYGVTKTGFAMAAQGSVSQSRGAGGWVKAQAHLRSTDGGPVRRIVSGFNSQIAPPAGGQPGPVDYGISVIRKDPGVYLIDFGFAITDRCLMVTAEPGAGGDDPLNPGDQVPGRNPYFSNLVIANATAYSRTVALVVTYTPQNDPVQGLLMGFLPTDCNFFIVVL